MLGKSLSSSGKSRVKKCLNSTYLDGRILKIVQRYDSRDYRWYLNIIWHVKINSYFLWILFTIIISSYVLKWRITVTNYFWFIYFIRYIVWKYFKTTSKRLRLINVFSAKRPRHIVQANDMLLEKGKKWSADNNSLANIKINYGFFVAFTTIIIMIIDNIIHGTLLITIEYLFSILTSVTWRFFFVDLPAPRRPIRSIASKRTNLAPLGIIRSLNKIMMINNWIWMKLYIISLVKGFRAKL